jgi:alpha-glucuronidase
MNTNQMMQIQIGKNYTVQIGHLDQIGKLNDVLEIGNKYREKKRS